MHDRNAITYGERQAIRTADQFGLRTIVFETALTKRADECIEKTSFHSAILKQIIRSALWGDKALKY